MFPEPSVILSQKYKQKNNQNKKKLSGIATGIPCQRNLLVLLVERKEDEEKMTGVKDVMF